MVNRCSIRALVMLVLTFLPVLSMANQPEMVNPLVSKLKDVVLESALITSPAATTEIAEPWSRMSAADHFQNAATAGGAPVALASADMNGDGIPDLIVVSSNAQGGLLTVYL